MRQIVEFRDRRDSVDNWTSKDPILEDGEHGYERGTGKFKIGNGKARWSELPYFVPEGSSSEETPPSSLADHVNDETPHPAYDDGPSLLLLYLNAKV